ncbi:MAG: DNA-binding protein WhiA, partial [Oscillospiraceae bacterium]|nr:DNA-binding protein WhiA [Oscillospiraceae bacterium]
MSFSSEVKNELCRENAGQKCCAGAMCYGILLYCNTFSPWEIKIMTENRAFAKILPRLFRRAFSLPFDVIPQDMEKPGKLIYRITQPEKIEKICQSYGYSAESMTAHHINLGVLENDCCKKSFIRGAFLAGGSVTDPEKQYHLELVTDHYNVRGETFAMLLDMGFQPKQTDRQGNYVIYFKQSDTVSDFLTTIGAPLSAMNVISAKIEKD